jgi:hypothetical protein
MTETLPAQSDTDKKDSEQTIQDYHGTGSVPTEPAPTPKPEPKP